MTDLQQRIAEILRGQGVGDACRVDWTRADRLASVLVKEIEARTMTGIERRIAEMLSKHEWERSMNEQCACSWEGPNHFAHVASVLVKELGLEQEYDDHDGAMPPEVR